MRNPTSASVAAKSPFARAQSGGDSPVRVVCAALALAFVFLACRIACVW